MKFYKNFSIYVLNNILNASIPFLLLPLLTSFLSRSEYGILTNIQAFITFTYPFVILGINGAINTTFFRSNKNILPSYIFSGIFLSSLLTIIITLIFFLFSNEIFKLLEIPYPWLLLIPLVCFFQTITQIVLVLYQAQEKALNYGFYQISMTATNLLFSIIFVALLKMNWEGRILGILISFFIFFIIGIFILYRNKFISIEINWQFIEDMLKFGIPLLPHMISGPIIQVLDRFFLTAYSGTSETGLYNVGYQIGIAVSFITFSFNQAWVPTLYKNLNNTSFSQKIKIIKNSYLFMLFFLFTAIVFSLVSPIIFKIFIAEKFHEAQKFVLPISIGSAFGGMYYIVANFIFYEKKTKAITLCTISSAFLSILLNIFLIPRYSASGAAFTFLISNVFNFLLVWYASNKIFPMPWFYFLKKNKI